MIELVEQAAEVQTFLDDRHWSSCVIGGLAVIRWGEPRLTRDVDISLFTGFGHEESFARTLLERFAARIADPVTFAVSNRVMLLRGAGGTPIDIAFAGLPFEEAMIDRASEFEYLPGIRLRTASAEDLIVLKAFANRRQDWVDIEGIVTRQRELDWQGIQERLAPLAELKEEPEILQQLVRVRGGGAQT